MLFLYIVQLAIAVLFCQSCLFFQVSRPGGRLSLTSRASAAEHYHSHALFSPMQWQSAEQVAVQTGLRYFKAYAKYAHESESWLVAKWDERNHRVLYGCSRCIAAIEKGIVGKPHRYRDSQRSNSFIHFNIFRDVRRGINFHLESKIHMDVTGITGTPVESRISIDEKKKLLNTAWLASINLLKLNPASNFIESVAEARQVGGVIMNERCANTAFYDSCLDFLEIIEKRTLKNEMSDSPFKVFVCGFDTDENMAALCVAFFTAEFQIASRVIRVEKWPRAKYETERKAACCALLSDSMADAGTNLQHMGACVQVVDRHHVMAEIRSQSQRCLPFWCSGHHDDSALRDQWEATDTQCLLWDFDAFFGYFLKCLKVQVGNQLPSYLSMRPVCIETIVRSKWKFPNTCKWDAPKPYICSLADDYEQYVSFCVFQETTAKKHATKDRWSKYKQFLMKADTYIVVHLLADFLEICHKASGLKFPIKICQMKAALAGYILGEPSESALQILGHRPCRAHSVVDDTLEEGPADHEKLHIQRGLKRIGFQQGMTFRHAQLSLKIDSFQHANAASIKSARQWGKQFAQGTIASLECRFPEAPVWLALQELMSWKFICRTHMPTTTLLSLAEYFGESEDSLQSQWQALQPVLASNAPQAQGDTAAFHTDLAKGLGNVPPANRGLLHSFFVTWLLTEASAENLKKKMMNLWQLYKQNAEHSVPSKRMRQLMVSRNHEERDGDARALASAALAFFSKSGRRRTSFKAQAPKRHVVSSDASRGKRRCLQQELTQSDIGRPDNKGKFFDAPDSDGDDGVIESHWLKKA